MQGSAKRGRTGGNYSGGGKALTQANAAPKKKKQYYANLKLESYFIDHARYQGAPRVQQMDTASNNNNVKLLPMNDIAVSNTFVGITQGDSQSQRRGKEIRWKSLQVRGIITCKASTVQSRVAYMVIFDKQPAADTPAMTDILEYAHSTSMNKDTSSSRFRILKRDDLVISGNTGVGLLLTGSTQVVDFYLDLKMKKAIFKGATGGIADYQYGALYMVTVGDQAAGAGAVEFTYSARLRYIDP